MQVLRRIPERATQPSVLSIGNFDGVHRGHQGLLDLLVERARALDAAATVLTFEPHPREYFSPETAPTRLASMRDKLLQLAAHGVDRAYVCRFDAGLAAMSAEDFVENMLVRGLDVRHLIIGDDFRFGARRQGDFALLQREGARAGFGVEAMPTLEHDGVRVSSSAVRAALADGALDRAAELLGRPYSIAGRVVAGKQLGRSIAYPTANIALRHRRPALTGVFAVAVEGLAPAPVAGIANLGSRPTVGGQCPNLEVHMLDWSAECYGAHLRVHFLHKLRDEARYDSLDALKQQIRRDEAAARAWFADHPLQD
ncbi:bifunctional riboflavin kinase/FAD synthetase [Pseudazoarcus pumilus]|uniref:Riboflavin biosynthesis protein n=1 Tax=Pseudazoarcus pumilus TaxID=2067960 RepID=A0A2I6S8P5_9RHOO|nr:bifunctional riboflavin kinase/FAD synthetase [Pseudazoarcus pumilus]AUN95615.1 bifunctional riboflavin kinase/FAD synthetase [Pseudazoarcus pumilus]